MSFDPSALQFREIERFDDPALPAFLDLYETAFPASERVPVSDIINVLLARQQGKAGNDHLLAAVDGSGSLAGMAWVEIIRRCSAAYLIYIAVVSPLRGSGAGSRMMEEIVRRLRQEEPSLQAIIIELDDPAGYAGEEREIAEKRIRFYRRLGAKLLTGIHYIQRVEFFPEGVPMRVAVLPLQEITPERAFEIARGVLGKSMKRVSEELALE
jgi:GNAT superfamily N-acetyltransferase